MNCPYCCKSVIESARFYYKCESCNKLMHQEFINGFNEGYALAAIDFTVFENIIDKLKVKGN